MSELQQLIEKVLLHLLNMFFNKKDKKALELTGGQFSEVGLMSWRTPLRFFFDKIHIN